VIGGTLKIMPLTVDLHEHLFEMPQPLAELHALNTAFPYL
jgi:hypothetical protein